MENILPGVCCINQQFLIPVISFCFKYKTGLKKKKFLLTFQYIFIFKTIHGKIIYINADPVDSK